MSTLRSSDRSDFVQFFERVKFLLFRFVLLSKITHGLKYPIPIHSKSRYDILHGPFDQNTPDKAEAFSIRFLRQCFIKSCEDKPMLISL